MSVEGFFQQFTFTLRKWCIVEPEVMMFFRIAST